MRGVGRNDESTRFVRLGSGSLPHSLGQDAISRGYIYDGRRIGANIAVEVYDNFCLQYYAMQ